MQKLENIQGDVHSVTYAANIIETANGDVITTGSQENEESDGAFTVKAYIRIDYKRLQSTGAPDTYLITNVSGGWKINGSQVQLTNQEVIYACYDPNGGSRVVENPTGTKFSYDTGFTYYVRWGCWHEK